MLGSTFSIKKLIIVLIRVLSNEMLLHCLPSDTNVLNCQNKERLFMFIMYNLCKYLRLGEVDKAAFLLSEVLRGPLLVLPVALILEHLNLIGAAEIISATGRDVWHGSLEITIQRHHSQLGSLHTTTGYGNHSWRWHTVTTTNTKYKQKQIRWRRRHYHLTYHST